MEGSLARALYTFQASQPGELTVQEGDVIRVTQYIDNHWLEAEHQGQTGLFPVTYAKRLEDEAPQGKLTSLSTSEQDLQRSVIEQWTYSAMEDSGQATEKLSNYNESNDGSLVEAAFAFGARNDSELTFPAGALIELARDVDDDWLEGSFNGKTGLFPKSYVKASSQKPCARAVYPFVGESQGELTFREGECIYLRKRLNSQWMEGELDGNVGLFPSSFVAVEVDLPPDDSVFENGDFLISESTPKHADWGNTAALKIQWKKGMKGKALFHFTALYSGDLELNEGDVVTILQADDDNWIEGQLPNGISGSCPAAYLEPISNDKTSPLHKQPAPNTGTQAFNAHNFTSVSLSDFSSDTGYSRNLQLTGSRNSTYDAELSSDDFLSSSQGSDFVDSWDPRNLLDSSLNSDDFTPVLLPSDTTSQFSTARPNSPLPTAKPLLKPKPALKPKPNEKCSVTYLGSESRNVGSSVEKSRTFPRPATSMPSLVSDVTASTTNSFVSASRVETNVRRAPRDTVQTELDSVRSSQSSSSSGYHYESTGTWPGKRGGIHKDTAVSSGKERSLNVMDKNDLLSGSCTSLPSPLVPLPRGGREDSRQSDSSEDSPVTPKRPAPPPPKKGSTGNNHVRSSTLPAPRTRNPVQNISSKEISPSKPRSRRQADGRILKADVEERTVKQRASSPHSNTRDSSLSPKGSPKSSGRISVNKPKTLPRPTSVYWGERDTGTMNSKGPLELKRSSSLEQLSTVKTSSNLAVADSAIFSHSDVQLDADNSEDSEEIGEVPGLAKLEERIADTEQNMKREMKVFTGMKTISQLVMTDPVKQQEMDAKVSRSQQKITEWQGELKHLKDEQAFLIESHRKKVLKITIADLESDLEKQVRSQRSLETLLGVVEENRKGEVMDNLGTCAQLVENIKIKLTELEASLHSLTEKPAASSQKHMAEQRQRVLTELINTEKDYCNDLELCVKHFLLELRLSEIKELDCESLFGNIENVLDTSRKLLKSLEDAVQDKEGKDQELGKCFVDIAEEMKEVYAVYCRNHDDAISLMEKYEEMPEVQDVLTRCLDKIREHTRCWDLSSFLIKPVQRVLKYPLLLNELLKYTPEIHRDKYNLLRAISVMTDVANAINEFKRRKDLVVKYKKVEDSGLTNMIQKLSWHSVVKKSSRFNQRLTQLTGLVSQTIDEKFIEEEKKFRSMEKTVKTLEKNILTYLDECQENAVCQQMSAENISDFYQEAATCSEVSTYHKVQNMVGETILIRFMDGVQQQVLSPLTALLNLFQGPQRLIQKRNDKCLDYDRWSNKIDKIKDRDKLKAAKDELELAKKNYEALNTQLLEEIPGFTKKCMALVVDCLENFSLAQSRLYFEIQQEYEQLLQLPVVQTRDADIVEHHTKRSVQVVEHFSDLSFIPCSFVAKDSSRKKRKSHKQPALPSLDPNALEDNNNSSKTDPPDTTEGELVGTSKKGPAPAPPSQQMSGDHLRPRPAPRRLSSNNRSESQDTDNPQLVEVTPGEGKVHIVEFNFEAQNVGELSVTEGVLVSVLRHCDTSGNPEWWLVHCNGSTGYVPESFLSPVEDTNEDTVFDEDKDTAIDNHEKEKASEEEIVVSSDKATPVLYYYAEFVFEASSSAELSLDEGQVVVVVQKQDLLGNDEWWLVDADGEKGYVPASYLTPVEE